MILTFGALHGKSQACRFHRDVVVPRQREHGTTLSHQGGLPVVEVDTSHLCAPREVERQEGGGVHTAPEEYEDLFSRCFPPDRVRAKILRLLCVEYTPKISQDH